MSTDLHAVSIAAHDPALLARFWAGVLRREVVDGPVGPELLPDGDPGFLIRFFRSDQDKQGPNQSHFDLTSASLDDQQAIVDRALGLGGRYLDVGQSPDEDHVVLADPEGNELCVVGPDNRFLAGTATIGCLSSDGLRDVGVFWSEALGWPLVWDQDTETAVQSPRGGSKISWGGDPVNPKLGPNRLHLDLSPGARQRPGHRGRPAPRPRRHPPRPRPPGRPRPRRPAGRRPRRPRRQRALRPPVLTATRDSSEPGRRQDAS